MPSDRTIRSTRPRRSQAAASQRGLRVLPGQCLEGKGVARGGVQAALVGGGVPSPLSQGLTSASQLLQAREAICVPLTPHPGASALRWRHAGGGQPLRGSPRLSPRRSLRRQSAGQADALHQHVARGLDGASPGHKDQGRQRGSARTPVGETASSQRRDSFPKSSCRGRGPSQPRVRWPPGSGRQAGARLGLGRDDSGAGDTGAVPGRWPGSGVAAAERPEEGRLGVKVPVTGGGHTCLVSSLQERHTMGTAVTRRELHTRDWAARPHRGSRST